MKTVAVILLGGKGTRFSADLPKQYIKIAGKQVVEHVIDIFQRHAQVDEICLVVDEKYLDKVEGITLTNGYTKIRKILIGGAERYMSSLAAIESYVATEDSDIKILFHDGVRPFVDESTISRCIDALDVYKAVDVAIKCTDTIIRVTDDLIDSIPNREYLRSGQTPQGFSLSLISTAYELAQQDSQFKSTDDCGVVKKYMPDEKIYVIEGSSTNIKITHKEDIYFAERLFQLKSKLAAVNEPVNKAQLLNDTVTVIFGGASGIGAELDSQISKLTGKVYSFSRRLTNTDIRSKTDVEAAIERVLLLEGRVDHVINAAGLLIKSPLLSMTDDDIEKVIDTNIKGSINIARASLTSLAKTKGSLLFFTSSSFTKGRAFYSTYSASKAAVVNFTQALSEEWSEQQVRVNCINPERTNTPMRQQNFGNEDIDTMLTTAEVAEKCIETLLSDSTGSIVDVRLAK